MSKKSVLGKGIGALLNNSIATPDTVKMRAPIEREEKKSVKENDSLKNSEMTMLDMDMLKPNVDQPRRVFRDEDINELSQSIKENGIIQPLIVTFDEKNKNFEIIAGERRFRAAKKAGLNQVPVFIKRVTKKEKLAMAIIENVQRADLNCVEEALAYFQLIDEFNLTQEQVAKTIGKSRSSIANTLRILRLPKEVLKMLQKEELSFGHAKVLISLKDDKEIISIANFAKTEGWSVKELSNQLHGNDELIKKNKPGKPNKKNEKFNLLKDKLERQTGFHFDIKANHNNKGKISIKFNSSDEFNTIYQFLLDL